MMRAFERLLQYVKYETASDPEADAYPSTPGQTVFANALRQEMLALGIHDAVVSSFSVVTGSLPSNAGEGLPAIGLIAHMDVSDAVPSKAVNARLLCYEGGDIPLDAEKRIILSPADAPELSRYVGQKLIVTDGSTLLGADNKAGIAEILTAVERLGSIPHGPIKLAFTPDEEIGRGMAHFDVAAFGADFAYTVDGGNVESVSYETFNAATADVVFIGVPTHPGEAKGKMRNALLLAMGFNALLPPSQRPEHTAGREGYYGLTRLSGDVGRAEAHYILRDHDETKLKVMAALMQDAAKELNRSFGAECVQVFIRYGYKNMAAVVSQHMHLVEDATDAIRAVGCEPEIELIRGGTDGAELSFMGIPCPNLGTGCHNAHSVREYIAVSDMDKAVDILLGTLSRCAQRKKV